MTPLEAGPAAPQRTALRWADEAEPPSPLFAATGSAGPDGYGVTATGELDPVTMATFAAEVDEVCLRAGASGHSRELLLDLAGVSFLDCAALLAVHQVLLAATGRGWLVRVVPPKACAPRRLMVLAVLAAVDDARPPHAAPTSGARPGPSRRGLDAGAGPTGA